jgi:2-keto-3-deoxy-L-rhamnonate aldolase RhmA
MPSSAPNDHSKLRISDQIDKAQCLSYGELKSFTESIPEALQTEIAGLIKFDDLVMDVQHNNEMKANAG